MLTDINIDASITDVKAKSLYSTLTAFNLKINFFKSKNPATQMITFMKKYEIIFPLLLRMFFKCPPDILSSVSGIFLE